LSASFSAPLLKKTLQKGDEIMKNGIILFIKKYKWVLFLTLNMIPFALDIAMYSLGGMFDLAMFSPVFLVLTFLNYSFFDKTFHYVIIQFWLLICVFCSGCLSTYLYYNNISNDPLTPIVGDLMVVCGTVIVLITTIITAFVKAKKSK
jgi:hypothetical protein